MSACCVCVFVDAMGLGRRRKIFVDFFFWFKKDGTIGNLSSNTSFIV